MFQDRYQIPNLRRLDSELHAPNLEAMVVASLSIEEYEVISYLNMNYHRILDTTHTMTFNLAAVICCSNGRIDDSVEVAFLPNMSTSLGSWKTFGADGCVMKDGWTRFDPNDLLANANYSITVSLLDFPRVPDETSPWLTQANYIFRELQIDSPLIDFVVIYHIDFVVSLTEPTSETQGFLFLCPSDHLQVGPSSARIPDFPWYWSLDPLGLEQLTAAEAAARGLPEVRVRARLMGRSWDERVYAGIRQLHEAKGFDPDTQDAARSLGQPLYQLSSDVDPLFAHVNELHEENDSVHLHNGDNSGSKDDSK
ncbi:hypothetical protein C8R46DRAFT_240814 [Mycena filopes]|nr:hypothetical protein C8R46DRAFT_240814 [Mycena filopes]